MDRKAARKLQRHPRRRNGLRVASVVGEDRDGGAGDSAAVDKEEVGGEPHRGEGNRDVPGGDRGGEVVSSHLPGDDMEIPPALWQDGHLGALGSIDPPARILSKDFYVLYTPRCDSPKVCGRRGAGGSAHVLAGVYLPALRLGSLQEVPGQGERAPVAPQLP